MHYFRSKKLLPNGCKKYTQSPPKVSTAQPAQDFFVIQYIKNFRFICCPSPRLQHFLGLLFWRPAIAKFMQLLNGNSIRTTVGDRELTKK